MYFVLIFVYLRYTDMESEDYSFYQGLVFLLEHNVKDLGYDLTFSTEVGIFIALTIAYWVKISADDSLKYFF